MPWKPTGSSYPKGFKLKWKGEGDKLSEANSKHKSQGNQPSKSERIGIQIQNRGRKQITDQSKGIRMSIQ